MTDAEAINQCIDNANRKYLTNNSAPRIYDKISKVSPGTSIAAAGVQWACNTYPQNSGRPNAVLWLTDEEGFVDNKDGTYTVNVNVAVSRYGKTTLGLVGAMDNKTDITEDAYASNVRICNRPSTSAADENNIKCDSDIGIEYGKNWHKSPKQSSFRPYDYKTSKWFLRAGAGISTTTLNEWTKLSKESVATITIDAEKLLSEEILNTLEQERGTIGTKKYRIIYLQIQRGYNDYYESGYGWSQLPFWVEEESESTSEFQTNTHFELDMGKDGSVEHKESSDWNNDAGEKSYTTSKYNNEIKFSSNIRYQLTKGEKHTASILWTGLGSTSTASNTITLKPEKKNSWTLVTDTWSSGTINNKTINAQINPGGSGSYCSGLSVPSTYSTFNGPSSTKSTSKICVKLTRAQATFTGQITATVKKNSSKTNVSIPANHTITLDESDDGYYEIAFTDTIKRNTDSSGDKVKTQYTASATGKTTETNKNTNELNEGGSQNVYTPSYSGTLQPGETVTRCNAMSYRAKQNTNDAMTAATNSEYCITITRPKKKCSINTSYEYGARDGENLGRVGSIINPNSSNASYIWTPVVSNIDNVTFETGYSNYSTLYNNQNVWAKPGDQIRFSFEACAGAQYVINAGNGSGGSHYATSGKFVFNSDNAREKQYYYYARKENNTEDKTKGYLLNPKGSVKTTTGGIAQYQKNGSMQQQSYRNPISSVDLTTVTNSTAIPYATWTTGPTSDNKPTSGFLSGNNIQMYGGSAAATPNRDETYTICKGKVANDCTFKRQDVGGLFEQTLSWNHLVYTNGADNKNNRNTYKTYSATAYVMVPYNYVLKPYVDNGKGGSSSVIYLGESHVMKPGIYVSPRTNAWVGKNGSTYATVTKKTTIEVRVYNGSKTLYYKKIDDVRLNEKNEEKPASGDESFLPNGVNIFVNDDGSNRVGDQICTEIKVYPIDSHDTYGGGTVYGAYQSKNNITNMTRRPALNEDYTPNGTQHIGVATSCSTVAKRPIMSVESSNAYSATKITTGLYDKKFSSDTDKWTFGSWSEYGVFAKVDTTRLFASGAALGYRTNIAYMSSNSNLPRTNTNKAANDSKKICSFMTQTFINSVNGECKSDGNISSQTAQEFVDDIIDRYGRSKYGVKYTNDSIDGSINAESYRVESGNSNSPVVIWREGSLILSGIPTVYASEENQAPNRTIVYNVKDDVVITGNINDQNGAEKSSLNDITGVVIIANNVKIDASVTYINATIIAKNSINTCYSDNGTVITIGTGDAESQRGTLNSVRCASTLRFDGPVFAKNVILNRTAGADYGADTIKRAEIFNLNMAAYLWSYYQMTNYSQAITTYSRELPTRY